MKILAIESSCDETAAAVVEDGCRILSNVVVSQIDIFAEYGGVIPEVAARSHLEAILPVVHRAMWDAGNLGKDDIDAIAVTHTPGLLGSLLIGTLTARVLAILWEKPLYAVHHLKSHIYANWLDTAYEVTSSGHFLGTCRSNPSSRVSRTSCSLVSSAHPKKQSLEVVSSKYEPDFPLLALVVSGGHTQIIRMEKHNKFEIIGTTRDDAVGECFDKVAKILGLPYPGGPNIAKMAERGNKKTYKLPHPRVEGLDFSFSGLKTAVLRAVQAELALPISTPSYTLSERLSEAQKADFAAAFQDVACEILVEKLRKAVEMYPDTKSLVIAGGVSANQVLRAKVGEVFANEGKGIYFPALKYAGDNAAMVGAAAFYEIQTGVKPTDPYELNIAPRQRIN